jgi:uncharacterized membrane protein (DUF4010 family)
MLVPLGLAGAAAVVYAGATTRQARRAASPERVHPGRPFDWKQALIFAATVSAVLLVAATVTRWGGRGGLALATALAGLADTHAAAVAAASLVRAEMIAPADAVLPILLGFTTNMVSKAVIAGVAGPRRFAWVVGRGLLVVTAAAWAGWLLPLGRP